MMPNKAGAFTLPMPRRTSTSVLTIKLTSVAPPRKTITGAADE
jgi:hypothetical protein